MKVVNINSLGPLSLSSANSSALIWYLPAGRPMTCYRLELQQRRAVSGKEPASYFKLLTLSTLRYSLLNFKLIEVVTYLIVFHNFQSKAIDWARISRIFRSNELNIGLTAVTQRCYFSLVLFGKLLQFLSKPHSPFHYYLTLSTDCNNFADSAFVNEI